MNIKQIARPVRAGSGTGLRPPGKASGIRSRFDSTIPLRQPSAPTNIFYGPAAICAKEEYLCLIS